MDFVAIDVETANADLASICQIGLVSFKQGQVDWKWESLIDPEDFFSEINVAIHGIDEEKVKGAPTLPKIADQLRSHLANKTAVCHTHFDRVAVGLARRFAARSAAHRPYVTQAMLPPRRSEGAS